MKVSGQHRFDAAPDVVWDGLQDPSVLASTMPGCEKLDLVGENQYEGAIKIKIGPVQGSFQGRVELEDIDPPNGYTMKVDGKGAPGFVRATARITLAPDGDGTLMTYDGDAQVGGRIASIGQRLVDSSAKAIIQQSLEGLGATIASRTAASAGSTAEEDEAPAGAPPPAAEASPDAAPVEAAPAEGPSQAEFASRVAREVAKDLVPRPLVIAIVAIVVIVVLYLLLR